MGSVAEVNEDVHGPAGRVAAWDGGGNVLCVSSDGPRGVESRREPRLLSIGLLEPKLDVPPRGLRPRGTGPLPTPERFAESAWGPSPWREPEEETSFAITTDDEY